MIVTLVASLRLRSLEFIRLPWGFGMWRTRSNPEASSGSLGHCL